MAKINCLLFDCDNTLVLSEVLAFEACADTINELLAKHNIDKRYTGEGLIKDFVGQNFRGMCVSLMKQENFDIAESEIDQYVQKEMQAVIKKLETKAEPCVGVMKELEELHESGKYKFGVVSSSATPRLYASIKKVGMEKYFPIHEGGKDNIYSAATSLEKPTTKPDPAIYLHAMKDMGVKPEECVAIEDSRSGTMSAVRAGIKTVGYVGPYPDDEKEEMKKKLSDAGAVIVMEHWNEFPACLEKIDKGEL